jgi:hypothetical protein
MVGRWTENASCLPGNYRTSPLISYSEPATNKEFARNGRGNCQKKRPKSEAKSMMEDNHRRSQQQGHYAKSTIQAIDPVAKTIGGMHL